MDLREKRSSFQNAGLDHAHALAPFAGVFCSAMDVFSRPLFSTSFIS